MTPAQIFISGARYSSNALHGDNHPRHIRLLGQQRKGAYTANVDGRNGAVTIDATGWWFTPLASEPPAEASPEPKPLPRSIELAHECRALRALLREWLDIDHWEDEDIAPRDLVTRTRLAVDGALPADALSPAKARQSADA